MSDESKIKTSNIEEREITKANGGAALFGIILGLFVSVGLIIAGATLVERKGAIGGITIMFALVLMTVFCIMFAGLKVIHPNEAAVYTFFGKYYCTIKNAGFYFINPFAECYNPSAASAIDELATAFVKPA